MTRFPLKTEKFLLSSVILRKIDDLFVGQPHRSTGIYIGNKDSTTVVLRNPQEASESSEKDQRPFCFLFGRNKNIL